MLGQEWESSQQGRSTYFKLNFELFLRICLTINHHLLNPSSRHEVLGRRYVCNIDLVFLSLIYNASFFVSIILNPVASKKELVQSVQHTQGILDFPLKKIK